MNESNTALAVRRSSRVPVSLPVLVTSLDPKTQFSEVCETLVVSAHGCAMRSKTKLDTGMRLRFRSREGRDTTAQVVYCTPFGPENQGWMLGAQLDHPDNFWGVRNCPKDWVSAAVPAVLRTGTPPTSVKAIEVPSNGAAQLSEDAVKRIISESLHPLRDELGAIKEKVLRKEANPSRFEVSLASIPGELQQQLEARLRTGLEPKMIEEARQRSAQLLSDAETSIAKKTKEVQEIFSRRLAEEHSALDKRGQEIRSRVSEDMQQRLHSSISEFERKLEDGGNRLNRLSQELLEFLQASLSEEHDARRAELEQLRASFSAESARLHKEAEGLASRIGKLDESVRSLESGLDERLSLMCSRTMKEARNELESIAGSIIHDATTRGAQTLNEEVDRAGKRITAAQSQAVASANESLERQAQEALKAFEKSMESLAKEAVERWKSKLAGALSALGKNFGEHIQSE